MRKLSKSICFIWYCFALGFLTDCGKVFIHGETEETTSNSNGETSEITRETTGESTTEPTESPSAEETTSGSNGETSESTERTTGGTTEETPTGNSSEETSDTTEETPIGSETETSTGASIEETSDATEESTEESISETTEGTVETTEEISVQITFPVDGAEIPENPRSFYMRGVQSGVPAEGPPYINGFVCPQGDLCYVQQKTIFEQGNTWKMVIYVGNGTEPPCFSFMICAVVMQTLEPPGKEYRELPPGLTKHCIEIFREDPESDCSKTNKHMLQEKKK